MRERMTSKTSLGAGIALTCIAATASQPWAFEEWQRSEHGLEYFGWLVEPIYSMELGFISARREPDIMQSGHEPAHIRLNVDLNNCSEYWVSVGRDKDDSYLSLHGTAWRPVDMSLDSGEKLEWSATVPVMSVGGWPVATVELPNNWADHIIKANSMTIRIHAGGRPRQETYFLQNMKKTLNRLQSLCAELTDWSPFGGRLNGLRGESSAQDNNNNQSSRTPRKKKAPFVYEWD